MKKSTLIVLMCLSALSACGGGGGNPLVSANSLSGNWQITMQNTSTGAIKSESGFLLQAGRSLTGNILLTGDTVCSGVGSVQGQVNDEKVSLSVDQVGATVNLTGTTTNGSMSGDYSILASPCGNTQTGTWTAMSIPALTGNVTGTFSSLNNVGSVVNLSGKITQGANNGRTTATLSGDVSTQGPGCLTSINVAGQISGVAVVLNLLSTEGVAVGQFVGTAAPDATSITGVYNVFPQAPVSSGCHDFGNGTLTIMLGSV